MDRPAGVFSEDYVEDMRLLRTQPQRIALLTGLVVAAVSPMVLSGPWIRFLSVTIIIGIAVIGLHILIGLSGQISIGQAAFMGVGAYGSAVTIQHLDWPFPLPMIVGSVSAALVGLIFGLPAIRTKGFYLALTTLAAQFVFVFTVPRLPSNIFGGAAGLVVPRPELFGIPFNTTLRYYYLTLVVGALMVFGALFIQVSRLGRALIAIRDDDNAAEVLGIEVKKYKVFAFLIAAAFAGVSGSLLVYEGGIAHYDQFQLFTSVWFLGMLIVGGTGRLLGAVLGVVALRLIEELVAIYGPVVADFFPMARSAVVFPLMNVAFGLVILAFLLFQPRGIAHLYQRTERRARLWPFPY